MQLDHVAGKNFIELPHTLIPQRKPSRSTSDDKGRLAGVVAGSKQQKQKKRQHQLFNQPCSSHTYTSTSIH